MASTVALRETVVAGVGFVAEKAGSGTGAVAVFAAGDDAGISRGVSGPKVIVPGVFRNSAGSIAGWLTDMPAVWPGVIIIGADVLDGRHPEFG